MSQPSLIAVVGPTGVGKSDLAVEIAKCIGGECINADAMQMYKGLPICTNKLREEEKCGIVHHLFDELDEEDGESYTVHTYLSSISPLLSTQTPKILVGGTAYYVEWTFFDHSSQNPQSLSNSSNFEIKTLEKLEISTILDKIAAMDVKVAESLKNVRDERKLRGVLEKLKRRRDGEENIEIAETYNFRPRVDMKSSYLIILTAEKALLDECLDLRIDLMIQKGLFRELAEFWCTRRCSDKLLENPKLFERGIFQSIGLKEFQSLLDSVYKSLVEFNNSEGSENCADVDGDEFITRMVREIERGGEKEREGETEREREIDSERLAGISAMQRRTRKYARKQRQWLRNRFLCPKTITTTTTKNTAKSGNDTLVSDKTNADDVVEATVFAPQMENVFVVDMSEVLRTKYLGGREREEEGEKEREREGERDRPAGEGDGDIPAIARVICEAMEAADGVENEEERIALLHTHLSTSPLPIYIPSTSPSPDNEKTIALFDRDTPTSKKYRGPSEHIAGRFECEPCSLVFSSNTQLHTHLRSRRHRNTVRKSKKRSRPLAELQGGITDRGAADNEVMEDAVSSLVKGEETEGDCET